MNERKFRRNVYAVIGTYCFAFVLGILLRITYPHEKDSLPYNTFKDLVPLIIAIPAAWISYCFQRRQSYLNNVTSLWSKIAAAVQDTIQYTYLTEPSQSDFQKVLRALALAIEEVRALFSNINENQSNVGLYPFESLKQIHSQVSALGFGSNFHIEKTEPTRREILSLWKKLRRHFLSELERGVPERADSQFLP